ncbi:MAG: 16S rRNA (guanine(527)-N(7))-methyltransferase RsmG [Bacilli bacterium]|nr:16S rRNA (guanine(527)-N(7))-methyltransferase RsmG [Bacilli bacterium]
MNSDTFKEELKKLGIELNNKQEKQLEKYYEMLIATNKITNLTRIVEKEDVYLKHFYDSLTIVKVIDLKQNLTLIDIGTGAGFPGLVLKIVFPNLKVTLLDSLNKRIEFLDKVIKELDLKDIKTVHSRIEDYKEEFDIVTSRAVAKTNILLELSCNLAKINGYYILLKGELNQELKDSETAIKELKLELEKKEEFLLPIENSKRTIIKLKKLDKVDSKYPRNFTQIKKNPL